MNTSSPFKVLFLCTGNSARSILAEYLLKHFSHARFESYSAGSNPKKEPHPMALRVLREAYKIDPSGARSKSWEEFKKSGATFDFIITVCDNARESCPVWPGQPILAHWGSPDPAAFVGTEKETYDCFFKVALQIQRRIELFCALPLEKLDRLRQAELTQDIGAR